MRHRMCQIISIWGERTDKRSIQVKSFSVSLEIMSAARSFFNLKLNKRWWWSLRLFAEEKQWSPSGLLILPKTRRNFWLPFTIHHQSIRRKVQKISFSSNGRHKTSMKTDGLFSKFSNASGNVKSSQTFRIVLIIIVWKSDGDFFFYWLFLYVLDNLSQSK